MDTDVLIVGDFLRPDGYVAYASARFSSEEFLAFLKDAWGWRSAGTKSIGASS